VFLLIKAQQVTEFLRYMVPIQIYEERVKSAEKEDNNFLIVRLNKPSKH
jgi:hypothetical protein